MSEGREEEAEGVNRCQPGGGGGGGVASPRPEEEQGPATPSRRTGEYRFRPLVLRHVCPAGNLQHGTAIPFARSGHRIVCSGPSFYSFGGYNPKISFTDYLDDALKNTRPLFQELWRFDLVSRTWTRIRGEGAVPEEVVSHSAVRRGANMLVFGGTAVPFGDSSSNSLYQCHLPTGRWQKVTTAGEKPKPMYGQAVCLSNDFLYVVGGTSGFEYSIDVHRLDLREHIWEHLSPASALPHTVPEGRYRHEVVEHEGALYVFGGGRSDASWTLTRLPTFLLEQRVWASTPTQPDARTLTFPTPRRCHVVVKVDKYVYLHGGYNGREAFRDLWRLNLMNFEWQLLPCQSSVPLYFHSAAVTEDGCMYMFGGVKDFAENTRTARVTKVWLGVARLWDMCLEALRHYRHKLPPLPPAACEGNRVAVHSKLQSLLSHTQGEEDVALRRSLQHSDENEEGALHAAGPSSQDLLAAPRDDELLDVGLACGRDGTPPEPLSGTCHDEEEEEEEGRLKEEEEGKLREEEEERLRDEEED